MHGVSRLRIVVMGTGPFAVPMLAALRRSGHEIVAVVTRPDHAPPGRRPAPNPVRDAATTAGLAVLDPERVNDPAARESLAALGADLFVVCDYGQILSAELLAVPPLGAINLHGSLLPRHRGAAPVQWAIRSGDAETGVSVIRMTPALDAGSVIVARPTAIGPRETAPELEARLALLGADAVTEAIERIAATTGAGQSVGELGVPQDPALATRAPRLTKAEGIVDWSLPAVQIERMRRALEPWPRTTTTFTRDDGRTQRLVLEDVTIAPAANGGADPGTVLATDGRITVACGEGTVLEIHRLVPEGSRSMSAADYLRGSPLRPGLRLG
ncbi:methionyl-tRNA formyltransferase [Planctomycetia bacterium]|nr:methionyl-tRNA formyltransferase [Planctomycetia bacterium]